MNRLLALSAVLVLLLVLLSCNRETSLFDEVNQLAQFDRVYNPILIKKGEESGFLEPMMEYGIFKIDSLAFNTLEHSILTNDSFKQGRYYLNIELDDYLHLNNLDILNMPKSAITENQYDRTYQLFLLSDRKTFVVVKVNY